jgi:hypothetical protein
VPGSWHFGSYCAEKPGDLDKAAKLQQLHWYPSGLLVKSKKQGVCHCRWACTAPPKSTGFLHHASLHTHLRAHRSFRDRTWPFSAVAVVLSLWVVPALHHKLRHQVCAYAVEARYVVHYRHFLRCCIYAIMLSTLRKSTWCAEYIVLFACCSYSMSMQLLSAQ